jgi:hypothetical protein
MRSLKKIIIRIALSLLSWAKSEVFNNPKVQKVINPIFVQANFGQIFNQDLAILAVKKGKDKFYYLLRVKVDTATNEVVFSLDRHFNPINNLRIIEIPWVKKEKFVDQCKAVTINELNKRRERKVKLNLKKTERENRRLEKNRRKLEKLANKRSIAFGKKQKSKETK